MRNIILYLCLIAIVSVNAQDLTALTYNIKYDNTNDTINNWNNRKEFLISQLNYNSPDVFGTQEALQNQLEDLKNGLKTYDYFGTGRDFGDNRGEFSAIFYNSKKLTLLKENTFWLSNTPNKPSIGWDAAIKRICTYGLFELKNTSKQFYVFNTHFDHIGENARIESAQLILRKIKEINEENLDVILMGDFNLESNSIGIQNILKNLNDTHIIAQKSFGPSGTFNGFLFNEPVTKKIDYIFSSKKIEVLKSGVLSDSKNCHYPSDHFPVYIELNFKN